MNLTDPRAEIEEADLDGTVDRRNLIAAIHQCGMHYVAQIAGYYH